MAKENPNKTKTPPIIFNHNECGCLIIGEETEDSIRPRDIGLNAHESDCELRLFRDGGFELRSSKNDVKGVSIKGSHIIQDCVGAPLIIRSEGSIHIGAASSITLDAQRIYLKSNAANEVGINIDAESDVRVQAGRDFLVTAENITHDAKERVLTHSEGWNILIAQCFRVHEPITKICPQFMRQYIDGQIKKLKG